MYLSLHAYIWHSKLCSDHICIVLSMLKPALKIFTDYWVTSIWLLKKSYFLTSYHRCLWTRPWFAPPHPTPFFLNIFFIFFLFIIVNNLLYTSQVKNNRNITTRCHFSINSLYIHVYGKQVSIENATDCRDISVIFDMTYIKGNEKKTNLGEKGERGRVRGTVRWIVRLKLRNYVAFSIDTDIFPLNLPNFKFFKIKRCHWPNFVFHYSGSEFCPSSI